MAKRQNAKRKQGRPRGKPTVGYPLRLLPEQKRDLDILSELMEGHPPINGLIQAAVGAYIARKLSNPDLRQQYEAFLNPSLRMLG